MDLHLRFGHVNFGGLKLLSKKSMVREFPSIDHLDQLCQGCLYRKHGQNVFLKEITTREKKPPRAYLCGCMRPNSSKFFS